MKKRDEKNADLGLEQLGINPSVYHFRMGVAPFTAITIVDNEKSWITTKSILDNIISEIDWGTELFYFSKVRYFKELLHENHIYGFALCSRDGYFDRERGRTIAKGRLLKYLKLQRGENEK